MAGTTPTYGWPYPTASDSPAGHTQMQSLATAVENTLIPIDAARTASTTALAAIGAEARYVRTSGSQSFNNGANTQVEFPTAIRTNAAVTPSGTNNTAFTLTSGKWIVTVSYRFDAAMTSGELSIASGNTTWAVGDIKGAGGSGSVVMGCSAIIDVPAATTVPVTANIWHTTGTTRTTAIQGELCHIDFVRVK